MNQIDLENKFIYENVLFLINEFCMFIRAQGDFWLFD